MTSAYDQWLTTQPTSGPLFHSYKKISEAAQNSSYGDSSVYSLAFDNFDELRCGLCSKPVGFLLNDNNTPATSSIVEFWQIDEDGEYLLCEWCYDEVTKEIGT